MIPALLRRLSPAGLLAVAFCASAGPGYLPVVGPPPLRFETPRPEPLTPPVVLPPLAFVETRPGVPATETTAPLPAPAPLAQTEITNAASATQYAEPVGVPFVPLLSEPLPTNSPGAELPPQFVAPQSFLKYFSGRPGTNSTGVSIYMPVEFVPPVPVAPPSSSATFQTTPPGKP